MLKRRIFLFVVVVFLAFTVTPLVEADESTSPNFRLNETVLGGSGLNSSQSTNFQSDQSSGILSLDTSDSSNFELHSGGLTTGDPALAFAITSSAVSFGAFSAASATVATSTFQVINYTSYGYIVQIIGTAPQDNVTGHTITAMSSTGASQAGTEQFGINLVANTSPVSVGANPNHGQFGFGSAASNYGTSNNYRYVSGETIASAPKSSGQTIYTITYLLNVSSVTPAGTYGSNQTIVCTGTY